MEISEELYNKLLTPETNPDLQADQKKGKYIEAVMSKVEKFMNIRKL